VRKKIGGGNGILSPEEKEGEAGNKKTKSLNTERKHASSYVTLSKKKGKDVKIGLQGAGGEG